MLFVYGIGISIGPGFFEAFKRNGLTLNGMALSLYCSAPFAVAIHHSAKIDLPVVLGSLSDLGLIFLPASILPRIESQISPKNIAAIARGGSGEIFGHPRRGWSAALGERSAQAERIHSLDVPGHGDEAPLAANAIESTQQELAECRFAGSTLVLHAVRRARPQVSANLRSSSSA